MRKTQTISVRLLSERKIAFEKQCAKIKKTVNEVLTDLVEKFLHE